MYSFFLLLSIWLFLIGLFSQRLGPDANRDHLLPLTFVLSCIVQFNINYLLIANVQAPRLMGNILMVLACVLLAASVLLPSYRLHLQTLLIDFLFPARQLVFTGQSPSQKRLLRLRILGVGIAIALMAFTQIQMPTVFNWDSNWYNLSRIPAMIVEHSVFPVNTPVLWQLLHSIGHDLLYLPDIALGSLRGMGLICSLEFLVILGSLYQITFALLSIDKQSNARVQFALLLVTILYLSSDLQILQSADPKNDLIILVTFVISLSVSANASLRRGKPFQYLLAVLLIAAYAWASKGYGMVVFIPPFIASALDVLDAIASRGSPFSLGRGYLRSLVKDGTTLFQQNRQLLLFVSLNVLIIAFAFVDHSHSVLASSRSAELAEMTSKLSNVNGSLSERLTIFALNAFRNSISFLLYPFTTLRKLHQLRPDDFVLGFGPFSSLIYDSRGMVIGPSIVRNIKADAAHGSIFLLPLIGIVAGVILRGLLRSGFRRAVRVNPVLRAQPSFIIVLSCLFSFLFFSYAIYNTPFVSKYMGPTYIPLIPLLAVGCSEFVDLHRKYVFLGLLIAFLYAILRFGFLLNFPPSPSFIGNVISNPASIRWRQNKNLFYYQYAGSRFTPDEADRWLSQLATLPPDQLHVFCFSTEAPSLTPLLHGIQSFNKNNNVQLRLAHLNECKKGIDHSGIPFGDKKKPINYIYLP